MIREERVGIGRTVAMKSAVLGEEATTAKKERVTVTTTLIVRAL